MTAGPGDGWTGKLAARQEAATLLTNYLLSKPDVASVRILDTLKFTLKSWVFVARINGQKVVVKRFFDIDPAHTVTALKGELDFVAGHLGDGAHQVNRCLMAWPADGTVVLSFARGPRLSDKIAQVSGLRRRALLAQAGHWLAAYTAPRLRHTTFGPRFWVQQMAQRDLSHVTDANDMALLEALLDRLRAQVPLTRGAAVVQGATHGDFVGINAHFHRGVITGVDIQGECWLALTKEAARFLVWEQIHSPARPDTRTFGIDAEECAAFLSSGVIAPDEYTTTLPFFLGEQIFGRLAETGAPQDVMANTRAAAHAYIDATS